MTFLSIISSAALLLVIAYGILIRRYAGLFSNIPVWDKKPLSYLPVTVVIPARNEEENIGPCLDAVSRQDYPVNQVEIIVADDHSVDATASVARSRNAKLISMSELATPVGTAYKKNALTAAVLSAGGELIVSTDADCVAPTRWISSLVSVLQHSGAVCVAAPVRMQPGRSFLSRFQSLDFAILQGITAATVHGGYHQMANGANMAYLKSAFNVVDGFAGIDHIASGDDMLLMQKFQQAFPGRIAYAFTPDAIVDTKPERSWGDFFRQRIRWASKAAHYRDKSLFPVLLLVYGVNFFLFLLMATCWISLPHFLTFLSMLLLKVLVEWSFVRKLLRFFGLRKLMPWFPVSQPLHILYTVISGFFGQVGTYTWKGRKLR